MKKSVSTAVAGVALALTTSSLALVMPSTATAAVSSACSTATTNSSKANSAKSSAASSLTKAKRAATAAKKAQKKAKKAVKKAVASKNKKKIKKTKKKLVAVNKKVRKTKATVKRATTTYRAKTNAANSAATARANACKTSNVNTPATPQEQALTAVLQVLLKNMGNTNPSLLGKDGVKGLLNSVAPDLGTLVSDELLGTIVALLREPIRSAADAAALFQSAFGGTFDSSWLTGDLTSSDLSGLAGKFNSAFQDVFGSFLMPGTGMPNFDATAVTGLLAQLTALANPEAMAGLGDFSKIFTGMISGNMPSLDPAQLTNVIKGLTSGQLGELQGLGILPAVIGGLTDGAGGLPGLSAIPVLGPILKGVLSTLKELLCTIAGPLC